MIIFLYGADEFRSLEKLAEIKTKFFEKTRSGSSLSVFDFGDSVKTEDVREALASSGLFSEKKLVIVKRPFTGTLAETQHGLLAVFEKRSNLAKDGDLVVAVWDGNIPKRKSKLLDYLEKNSKKQEFSKLTGNKLSGWIAKRVKKYDSAADISPKAAEKLALFCGDNLFLLDNEIQKLINYKAGESIEEKDIDEMVKSDVEADIFETVGALSSGNKKMALDLFHRQLSQGEDVFRLFSMYVYQFRNLLKIADYYYQGERNQYAIAKLAKIHPYVAGKGIAQLRNFTLEKLKTTYGKLSAMDAAAKTGKVDLELELEKFIVKM